MHDCARVGRSDQKALSPRLILSISFIYFLGKMPLVGFYGTNKKMQKKEAFLAMFIGEKY
jgi:hypothetical protein